MEVCLMDKEQFNSLEVIEQINYINDKLSEGNTLSKLAKEIGIGRSTISDRFNKVGYKYNSEVKQYQCYVEIVDQESVNNVVGTDNQSKDINSVESGNLEHYAVTGTNNEILVHMVNNYDDNLKKLNEMYAWYVAQTNDDVVVEPGKFIIKEFKGNTVSRNFKLYEPLQKKLMRFCKKNNKYKIQDIVCTLLDEALENYKD